MIFLGGLGSKSALFIGPKKGVIHGLIKIDMRIFFCHTLGYIIRLSLTTSAILVTSSSATIGLLRGRQLRSPDR